MNFDKVKKRLKRNYRQIVRNHVTFFINDEGNVVATENAKHNLLVMYVYSDPDTLWNHHDTVAIGIAKDFKLVHNYTVSLADVMVIVGLCGACTTIERISNMLLEVTSSADLTFSDESLNLVDPLQIIDTGILDSNQFAGASLDGALIDATVKDANGITHKAPYVVGKGLVLNPHRIGTMGCMKSSSICTLDIGMTIDMSTLTLESDKKHSHTFSDTNLVYGVMATKKPSRTAKEKNVHKCVQPDTYTVYKYLREKNSWYWESGYNTCGSSSARESIMRTKCGTNYHKASIVTVTK